jgi:NTP pyrophosphatase (non-canonical NTP hydrolase)
MYYIYHIPGKKIGVTRNLNKRVTQQQGFAEGEYEVLFESEDIDEVSRLEIELQNSYGYPTDRTLYKHYINRKTMNLNPTEQTTTFPTTKAKLSIFLRENLGAEWETPQGWQFSITEETIPWILKNAVVSTYRETRVYIYNKAFKMFLDELYGTTQMEIPGLQNHDKFDLIRKWASERGIYEKGDVKTQFSKLVEEVGELAKAVLENDEIEFVDAIGDCVVVLTNLAHLGGHKIEECIDSAYNQIKNRQGTMTNGTFVKEEVQKEEYHPDSSFGQYIQRKSQSL